MSKPKVICISGGIGSGKSTLCAMLKDRGFDVYNSDTRAKVLMNSNKKLVKAITAILGPEAYVQGELNKGFVSKMIFSDQSRKSALEAAVHPAVRDDFNQWKQDKSLVFKESALVFETGDASCEYIISVVADEDIRIKRVLQRNPGMQAEQVLARMKSQISDSERRLRSHAIVENNESLEDLRSKMDYLLSKVI